MIQIKHPQEYQSKLKAIILRIIFMISATKQNIPLDRANNKTK